MSQSDAGIGGDYADDKEFFKSLVSLAMADGKITHEEYDMLYIIGKKANVPYDEVDAIIKNGIGYNSVTQADKETNQRRLINLIKMMWADGEMDEKELQLVEKFSEGLGFEKSTISKLVRTISEMIMEEREESEILAAIK